MLAHHRSDPLNKALEALLSELRRRGYRFVTPTPATHARVVARPERAEAVDLADVFGWSLPFRRDLLDDALLALLSTAGLATPVEGGRLKAAVRVSTLNENLYIHSAYPTDAEDAVFFGPDSYRFADFIAAELLGADLSAVRKIVDIGTGAGVGAITAGELCADAQIVGTDINDRALRFAMINAAAAGLTLRPCLSSTLDWLDGSADLIVANPPYLIDSHGRAYRDGGAMLGAQVSLDMTTQALPRLTSNGRFLLYTGSAIVRGEDPLRAELEKLSRRFNCTLRYRELDPDVFGEELDGPAYRDVDRITVIGAVMSPRRS